MDITPEPNSTSIFESKETDSGLSDTVKNIIWLLVQSVIFLFGVPGNCLILRVYWTKTQKTSTHVFIMALAWADLTVCVLAVHRIYNRAASMADCDVPEFTLFIWALETTAIGTSIMMTALISVDRYDCVCRPHRRFFTHKRGKIAAWAAFVFSLVINIPAFIPRAPGSRDQSLDLLRLAFQVICFVVALVMIALCYGKVYMTIKKHTKVGVKNTSPDFSVSRLVDECSTRIQGSALKNVEPNLATVSSVSTFTNKPCSSTAADASRMVQNKGASSSEIDEAALGSTLTKHVVSKDTGSRVAKRDSAPRQHQGNGGRTVHGADAAVVQRKTTRMLFITSVVFLLTWLPYWMLIAATFASYDNTVFHIILGQLSVTLYVNDAVNPLIYGLANRRFRKDCLTVLRKMKLC